MMFVTGLGVTAAAQAPVTALGQGVDQGQGEGHVQDPEAGQEEGHTRLLAVTFKLWMMRLVRKMI